MNRYILSLRVADAMTGQLQEQRQRQQQQQQQQQQFQQQQRQQQQQQQERLVVPCLRLEVRGPGPMYQQEGLGVVSVAAGAA